MPDLDLALPALEQLQGSVWEFDVVRSVSLAKDRIRAGNARILLSGMGPQYDDALLSAAKDALPSSARILVVGPGSLESGLVASRMAHQVLQAPVHGSTLEMVLDRATGGVGLIFADRVRALFGSDALLPSLPRSLGQLLEVLDDPEASTSDILRALRQDPILAANVLALANSAYFRLPRRVATLPRAVSVLGTTTLRALAIYAQLTEGFPRAGDALLARVRQNGLMTLQIVRHIAGIHAETALTAAIVQDIGQLILNTVRPRVYDRLIRDAEAQGRPIEDLEQERLGATHAQVGAALLWSWGLPKELVQAVGFSHTHFPPPGSGLDTLALLYLSRALVWEASAPHSGEALDPSWLAALDIHDRTDEWRRFARDLAMHWPGG